MDVLRKAGLVGAVALLICGPARSLRAQTVLGDALAWLPQRTVALEFSSVSTLRTLPDYSTLRTRFLGKNLRALESSLAALGIQETDIDQMVLGWQIDAGNTMRYEGVASGDFGAEGVERRAAASKIVPRAVGGIPVYCFPKDPNRTCVAVLDQSLGVFGPLPSLELMLKARASGALGLASDRGFASYVQNAESDAPIWGVATGPAVSKWFKAWMPGEKNLQMDWAAAFKDVRAISYTIEAADNVHLNVKLDCDSLQAASSMRQLLEGMKLVQQLAWKSANPGQPNPFENVTVSADNREVSFKLTADYAALNRPGALGNL